MKRNKFAKIITGMNNPDNAGIHQQLGLVDGASIPAAPMKTIPKVTGFINR